MKSFIKDFKEDPETIWGGVFGLIAVIAVFVEMFLADFEQAAIAGGIKDIFGTLVVIMLFFSIIKDKLPRGNFRDNFNSSMKKICSKYNYFIDVPEIKETNDSVLGEARAQKLKNHICYNMCDVTDKVFMKPTSRKGSYRFLEIADDETTKVAFLIRKTFFDCHDFSDETLKNNANKISSCLQSKSTYDFQVDKVKSGYNIIVDTKRIMKTKKDANELSEFIDLAIFLFIAEYRKQ